MSLWKIAWKSMRQRALASSLTALSVALGVMLMVAVLVIYSIVSSAFSQRTIGFHLIVGPKGSDLDLVLSTVYRIRPPLQNLPYLYYEQLREHPLVVDAVPIAMGDTTQEGAFPIVGTTTDYFRLEYAPQRRLRIRGPASERGFEHPFDAVIGSRVARDNKWDIGSQFTIVHGGADSDHVHDEVFTVQGVLAPTGTPNDKSVFIHLNGFYAVAGHEKPVEEALRSHREFFGEPHPDEEALLARDARMRARGQDHHHGPTHDALKEVTAIFVNMRSQTSAALFSGEMRRGHQAQAVNPIIPMGRLMNDVIGNVLVVLVILTGLIIVVSGVGIFVSIYNSMSDRRREIAVMRALGAQRWTVFSIVLAESVLLCFGGGVLGLLLGHGAVFVAAPYVETQTGLLVNPLAFHPMEAVLFPALLALASLVGFLPGLTAYRTDVARALAE